MNKDTLKVIGIVMLVPVAIALFGAWSMIFSKPVALVNQATNTTKMIQNYEWFYEAANTYNARVAQVASTKKLIEGETDKAEISRLRVDLGGVQQSCRELVAKYEAQSGKIHVGYLKSKDLPESLDAKKCE